MKDIGYYLKYVGLFLTVVSLAFLSVFFIRRSLDRKHQLEIMQRFEETLHATDDLHNQTYLGATSADKIYFQGDTLALLSIDRLDIKVSVVEGVEKEDLKLSAGHFPETAMPGKGNFAIAGHSSLVYTCLFNNLKDAVVGDEIFVQTKSGDHTYEITDIFVVEPDDLSVLDDTDESVITIVTCTNAGKQRKIFRGKEI